MNTDGSLDIQAIMRRLPHRYPFLLVDRVLEIVPGKSIRALKNVTYNEPFFNGHFPHRPVMPGVLIIEALAQTSGVLTFISADKIPTEETQFYFAGIDRVRFRAPVIPGDQLHLISELERTLRGIWRLATRAEVNGRTVADAVIMIAPDLEHGADASGGNP